MGREHFVQTGKKKKSKVSCDLIALYGGKSFVIEVKNSGRKGVSSQMHSRIGRSVTTYGVAISRSCIIVSHSCLRNLARVLAWYLQREPLSFLDMVFADRPLAKAYAPVLLEELLREECDCTPKISLDYKVEYYPSFEPLTSPEFEAMRTALPLVLEAQAGREPAPGKQRKYPTSYNEWMLLCQEEDDDIPIQFRKWTRNPPRAQPSPGERVRPFTNSEMATPPPSLTEGAGEKPIASVQHMDEYVARHNSTTVRPAFAPPSIGQVSQEARVQQRIDAKRQANPDSQFSMGFSTGL
jgi:hypothetical protein